MVCKFCGKEIVTVVSSALNWEKWYHYRDNDTLDPYCKRRKGQESTEATPKEYEA